MPTAPVNRPNIILILSDDQDWNGLSVRMHPDIAESRSDYFETPNLEKFAAQGMRFSNGYAPAPVCSPTRISLQTGMTPARLGWTKAAPAETGYRLIEGDNRKAIRDEEVTFAELLRKSGYATAHFGKWHLSGGGPEKHGYDVSDGDTGNREAEAFKDPNPVDIFGMTDRAKAFMEKNQRAGKPFYLQMSYNALHVPENANRSSLAKFEAKAPRQTASRPRPGGHRLRPRHRRRQAAGLRRGAGPREEHLRDLHGRQRRRRGWRRQGRQKRLARPCEEAREASGKAASASPSSSAAQA